MTPIVTPPPGDAATPRCPVCTRPATDQTVRVDRGIHEGQYLDGAGHIWSMRWVVLEEVV